MRKAIVVAGLALAALPVLAAASPAPVYESCVAAAKRDMPGQDGAWALKGCSCLAEKAPEGSPLAAELSGLLDLDHQERMSRASSDASAAMTACFS